LFNDPSGGFHALRASTPINCSGPTRHRDAAEEKEIVHVGLTALAAAVRQQRARILQLERIELVDGDGAAVFQKKTSVRTLLEKLEDGSGRPYPVPVLRFHQEYRLAVFKQLDRTFQNTQFMSLDVDLYERNILPDDGNRASPSAH